MNFGKLETASVELTNRMLSMGMNRDSAMMDGVFIASFLPIGVGILSIIVILFILRRHR